MPIASEKKEIQEPTTPGLTTVKQLFARSGNRCAFPKCTSPIVQGKTIIGKICHIKASKPGGPRYDPNQTAADRHGYNNLILLCGNHHTVIDDDEETYTVDRLLKMKADHEQIVPVVPEGETEQAIILLTDQSVHAVNQSGGVTAQTANISLGGEGGKSPGAGGGGGGVIGAGVAGPGGSGGNIILTGNDGQAAGAGGGGAGAIGPGTVGGEGGGGGECVEVLISSEELRALRIAGLSHVEYEIGRGGKATEGCGEDGADTIVRFVTSDGKVLKSIRARGGKGGRRGSSGE